jgi:hypothetical protein
MTLMMLHVIVAHVIIHLHEDPVTTTTMIILANPSVAGWRDVELPLRQKFRKNHVGVVH